MNSSCCDIIENAIQKVKSEIDIEISQIYSLKISCFAIFNLLSTVCAVAKLKRDCTIAALRNVFMFSSCMLSLRSSYFTAMFNGDWRESDATEVTLHG